MLLREGAELPDSLKPALRLVSAGFNVAEVAHVEQSSIPGSL